MQRYQDTGIQLRLKRVQAGLHQKTLAALLGAAWGFMPSDKLNRQMQKSFLNILRQTQAEKPKHGVKNLPLPLGKRKVRRYPKQLSP